MPRVPRLSTKLTDADTRPTSPWTVSECLREDRLCPLSMSLLEGAVALNTRLVQLGQELFHQMSISFIRIVRLCFAVAATGFSASPSHAQLPTAELQTLSRQVVQAGVACDITLAGSRLDELSQLAAHSLNGLPLNLAASPRRSPAQPLRDDQPITSTFDLSPPASLPVGLIEVRAVGRFGISNPRTLLISGIPVELPGVANNNLATAYPIKADHLINDNINEKSSKYYRCDVKPGQRLRCVAYCKQLDSFADLNLRLLNKDGKLISSSRTAGQWPAELDWVKSTNDDQPAYIEVRDLLYRGGPSYNFAMEVRLEDATTATPQIFHLDSLLRPTLELPLTATKFLQPLGVTIAQRGWSETAMGLSPNPIDKFPSRLVADLLQPSVIPFSASKDQLLSFEIASASLDQLTDPAIIIYKVNPPQPDGTPQLQQVAEQDDAAYGGTPAVRIRRVDPLLVWQAPETASYQLHIVDRQTGERPLDSRRFLLEIRPAQPSFALIAYEPFPTNTPATSKPWGNQLSRNGTSQLHVSVLRYDGFNDPIELQVEGLPAHCSCQTVVVPAGATEADLVIQAVGDIDNSLANLSIVGTAKLGERTLTSRAVGATINAAVIPTRNAVSSRYASIIPTQLVNIDTAPLQLQLGDGNPVDVKAGAKFTLPVKLIRQPGSVAECTLRPQALPPKVGLGEFKVPGDKSEASPEVTVPADAPVGTYTFWVQAETKVKWRANPQQLTREEAYSAKLKSAIEANSTGDIPRPAIEAALAQANARVEELKKSTAEQEYTIFLPSNPIRVRILPKE